MSPRLVISPDTTRWVGPCSETKVSIPFKLINNLIIITIKVNDVPLNFLLDTGVEESILFSLDETDEISFANIQKIKIKGFGKKEAFDGYKSTLNKIEIKNFIDNNHTLYLVLDQDINISSNIGVPVNGIIGYHFFKNNLVKIDYQNKKIIIYKNKIKQLKNIEKTFSKMPLVFHDGKPYLNSNIMFENSTKLLESKLLIDTGNSDAIWLFKNKSDKILLPIINIEDYLGRGFSGDVFGLRGRVQLFQLANLEIKNPIVAFPNSIDTEEIEKIENRLGSVGSEIMKRFTVFFDYQNEHIYLKKNVNFDDEFNFNMSGIDIQHQGLQWIKESYENNPTLANNIIDGNGDKIANNLKYKFELKPVYMISNVRKNSSAESVGLLKDDLIVKINRRFAYNYTLQDINNLLKSEEGKIIEIEVDRNGRQYNFKIILKKIL